MSRERVSMRKIRELLRLIYVESRSVSEAAISLKIGETTIRRCLKKVKDANLSWPIDDKMDDFSLEKLIYFSPRGRPFINSAPVDCVWVYQELKKNMLLDRCCGKNTRVKIQIIIPANLVGFVIFIEIGKVNYFGNRGI